MKILADNGHIFLRLVILRFHVLNFPNDTLSIQDITKNDVFAVEMRCGNSRDEELGAVCP